MALKYFFVGLAFMTAILFYKSVSLFIKWLTLCTCLDPRVPLWRLRRCLEVGDDPAHVPRGLQRPLLPSAILDPLQDLLLRLAHLRGDVHRVTTLLLDLDSSLCCIGKWLLCFAYINVLFSLSNFWTLKRPSSTGLRSCFASSSGSTCAQRELTSATCAHRTLPTTCTRTTTHGT